MSETDFGLTGAKQQSTHNGDPRSLLARILEKDPKVSDADILEMIREAIAENPEHLEAILLYWITNERRNLTRRPYSPRNHSPQERKAEAEKEMIIAEKNAAEMIKEFKTDVFRSKFLDMMVPSLDKPVRECTVAEMGTVIGAFSMFANCGEPHQKIGELFTDEEAQRLYDQGLKQA